MEPLTAALALSKFVPDIVKWVTGSDKAAAAADTVVAVAKAVTGQADTEAAVQHIAQDPAAMLAFQTRLAEMKHDLDKAYLLDTQDARARDVKLAAMGRVNVRANWMVALDVVGLLSAMVAMVVLGWFKATYPEQITEGIFGVLMAQLSTLASVFGLCLRDAHQFEFGSSRGSRMKDERP